MTGKQIEYLKYLGYKDTEEEGAILEHPKFTWETRHIWKHDQFIDVLLHHNKSVEEAIRQNHINQWDCLF